MLGFSHRNMRGRQGKCGFSGCTSDPVIPHCLHWQRLSLSLSQHSVFLGRSCLVMSTLVPCTRGISPSSAVTQWMTSPASVSPAVMNDDQHKDVKIIPQFPNLFNPLFYMPLGSLPSLGASSSSFRRVLSFPSESCWTVEPLSRFLVGNAVWFSRGTQPTDCWVLAGQILFQLSGWTLLDLLETLLWSESQEETTVFPRAFWMCCSIPGNRRRRRKWSIKFPLLWKAETSVGACEWGWKWYLPARSWHLICSDPVQNNSCFLPWKTTGRNLWVRICPRHWKAAKCSLSARLCAWTHARGASAQAPNEVHPLKSQLSNGCF